MTPARRVEVKTRTSPQVRARLAKVAARRGRSVSRELELAIVEHCRQAELELELEGRRQAALERIAGV